jgi:DNA-directed RNA polymerase specialized sigma24 family protein
MASSDLQHVLDSLRMVSESDSQLLERFVTRNQEAAFTELVRRHMRMVRGVCSRILWHAQEAQDACQETFVALFQKAPSIRERASIAAWLHRVATNKGASANRSRTV